MAEAVLACYGDCDWMSGLSSWFTGQHPIINLNVLPVFMYANYATALLTIPGKSAFLPKISSLLIKGVFSFLCGGLGQGGVINI